MIEDHRIMLRDRVRMDAFERALRRRVRPGQRVADIGTGTGIMALLAARAGASTVFAIEETDVIALAGKIAAQNGFAEKIRFIKGHSRKVRLPARVDAVVSETLGHLGFDENIAAVMIDARTRFLKPGGRLIPRRLTLRAVPFFHSKASGILKFWRGKTAGMDLSEGAALAENMIFDVNVKTRRYGFPPKTILKADFQKLKSDWLTGTAEFRALRTITINGLLGWFNAELAPGLYLSNEPGGEATHWRQGFFPLPEPVRMIKGGRIRWTLRLQPVAGRVFWAWEVNIDARADGALISFNHSTFRSFPLSHESLKARVSKRNGPR